MAVDPTRQIFPLSSKNDTAIAFGQISSVVVEEDFVQGLLEQRHPAVAAHETPRKWGLGLLRRPTP
jgi:hypothetical protein